MEKTRLLITIRGGNIVSIESTNENVQIQIVDHDNLIGGNENDLNSIDSIYQLNSVMSNSEIDGLIKVIKSTYKKQK